MNLEVDAVYGNGKGQYRKIVWFTNTLGEKTTQPLDIWYQRCNRQGVIVGEGKPRNCWVNTFQSWAKERVTEGGVEHG